MAVNLFSHKGDLPLTATIKGGGAVCGRGFLLLLGAIALAFPALPVILGLVGHVFDIPVSSGADYILRLILGWWLALNPVLLVGVLGARWVLNLKCNKGGRNWTPIEITFVFLSWPAILVETAYFISQVWVFLRITHQLVFLGG